MLTNLREVGTSAKKKRREENKRLCFQRKNNISAWLNIAALLSFSAC